MGGFATRKPLLFVTLVMLILQATVLAALFVSQVFGVPLLALDLPVLLLNAVVAATLLSRLGWWRAAGFNAPRAWRNLHLLIVPAALLLGPTLLLQPQLPPLERVAVLVVITLLIGFQEEAIFRGVLLRALAPRGIIQAVLISAFLFGVIHANSLLVGRAPLFVVAQIVASFLGAIGLAALWYRLNTIWPLVFLHALNDFLQFTATGGLEAQQIATYLPYLKIGIASLIALYGLYLLRGALKGRATSSVDQAPGAPLPSTLANPEA